MLGSPPTQAVNHASTITMLVVPRLVVLATNALVIRMQRFQISIVE
jgi:hypothetical protein